MKQYRNQSVWGESNMGQGEAHYGGLRKIKDQRTGGLRRGKFQGSVIPGKEKEENV